MAGHLVTIRSLLQFRPLDTAKRHLPDGTARMKRTARGRVNRVRYFPLKQNTSALYLWIRNSHRGEQRLGVRKARTADGTTDSGRTRKTTAANAK
jgi:hypothetical protein